MGKIEKTKISDFWGPPSNDGKEYHKLLSGCSMGSKYLLNFTCLPMKFHDCHHINIHEQRIKIIWTKCMKIA